MRSLFCLVFLAITVTAISTLPAHALSCKRTHLNPQGFKETTRQVYMCDKTALELKADRDEAFYQSLPPTVSHVVNTGPPVDLGQMDIDGNFIWAKRSYNMNVAIKIDRNQFRIHHKDGNMLCRGLIYHFEGDHGRVKLTCPDDGNITLLFFIEDNGAFMRGIGLDSFDNNVRLSGDIITPAS